MKKKIMLAVLALIASGLVLLTGTAANADVPCNTGMLCLYTDANWAGSQTIYSNPAPGCINLTAVQNDHLSSLHNYLSHSITMHRGTCGDTVSHINVAAGASAQNLNALPYIGWNDAVSSITINSSFASAPAGIPIAYVNLKTGAHGIISPSTTKPPLEGGTCDAGEICFWTGANFTGTVGIVHTPTPSTCYTPLGSFDNVITSMWNRYSRATTWKEMTGCSGVTDEILNPTEYQLDLSFPYDNAISSFVTA
jgi:hypothetical protein